MKEFFLFRHGETDWNRLGRLQGSANIPLNKTGIRQAEALREFFDTWKMSSTFKTDSHLVSSDLDRATATARIAFRCAPEAVLRVDSRFRETHMGLAEGLTHKELVEAFGEEVWLNWIGLGSHSWQARFPEGESKGEVRDRALAAMKDLANDGDPGSDIRYAIATHGGLLRRLLHHFHPEVTKPIEVVNGAVFRIYFADENFNADLEPVFQP